MFSMLSYLSASVVFATVLMLTFFLWRGRLQGPWLIQALVITLVWSGYLAFSGSNNLFNPSSQLFLEILRDSAWVLLLWKLYSFSRGIGTRDFWHNKRLWMFAGAVLLLLVANLLQSSFAGLQNLLPNSLPTVAPFLLATVVLVMLEQWYRNIPLEQRWSVKFFCVGTTVIFGYDFLLYSEALLFNRIDPSLWEVRGWVNALMAPLLAVSIARSKEWDRNLRFSHQLVFFSTGVLLAGIYLLIMASVGYYLRWFGAGWGNAVQIIFVVLALSFFGLLVSSGRFRAIITVWVSKHFFSYKYDYREEWMKASARFASLPADERYFEQLILGIAEPLDSLGGVLWVKEGERFVVKGNLNLAPLPDLSPARDRSLLAFMQAQPWVVDVPEFLRHPDRYPNLEIDEALLESEALWLMVPLVHQDALYGLVGLAHSRADRTINWEDHDLLKTLGAQLAALIALRNTSQSLTEARQFEAYNQLSAFVVHDIKNVVAQLSMVVANAEKHKHNPEFVDDSLDTLSHAVGRMKRMLSQLKQQSDLHARTEIVEVGTILDAVQRHQKDQRPPLDVSAQADGLRMEIDRERLVSVLCHLVQNAQEATGDQGRVGLDLQPRDGMVVFTVTDTGCGMDEQFIRERLFKPFDTTKGRAGMGIGVYEARQFILANGGELDVQSTPGEGSRFSVALPTYREIE